MSIFTLKHVIMQRLNEAESLAGRDNKRAIKLFEETANLYYSHIIFRDEEIAAMIDEVSQSLYRERGIFISSK